MATYLGVDLCGTCGEPFADGDVKYIQPHERRWWHQANNLPVHERCLPQRRPFLTRWIDAGSCEGCGHPMHTRDHTPGPRRVVCSDACAQRAYRARRRVTGATCASCGETFSTNRRHASYCSSPCRQRAYRQRLNPGSSKSAPLPTKPKPPSPRRKFGPTKRQNRAVGRLIASLEKAKAVGFDAQSVNWLVQVVMKQEGPVERETGL